MIRTSDYKKDNNKTRERKKTTKKEIIRQIKKIWKKRWKKVKQLWKMYEKWKIHHENIKRKRKMKTAKGTKIIIWLVLLTANIHLLLQRLPMVTPMKLSVGKEWKKTFFVVVKCRNSPILGMVLKHREIRSKFDETRRGQTRANMTTTLGSCVWRRYLEVKTGGVRFREARGQKVNPTH